jgi:hypothetical protein
MHAHDRAVDHLHLPVVGLDDSVHQAVPDARFSPPIEAVVRRGVGPVSFGKIAPRCAGAQYPEDAVENNSIVLGLHAALILRQQRLDDAPLEVCEIVAHDPSSDVCQLESLFESHGQQKLSTDPSSAGQTPVRDPIGHP